MKDNMKDNNQKKGSAGKVIRFGSLALAAVLTWQVVSAPISNVISALAEEGGPLSKIYSILSDNIGEPETAQDYYELANISIGKGEYEKALEQLENARGLLTIMTEIELTDDEIKTEVENAETSGDDIVTDIPKQTLVEEEKTLTEDELLNAELWLKTASVHILTGNIENAQLALTESLNINPDSAQALLLRSQLAIETMDYDAAAADLEKYLGIVPEDTAARLTFAQLFEAVADYERAVEQYDILHELLPDDESYELNALRCRFLNGEYEAAIEGFDAYKLRHEGEETDSFGGIADFLRAASLMQMGDYAAAAEGFEFAIAAGYDKATCLEQITLCCFENGEYEKVLSAGEELIALGTATAAELVHQRMGISNMRLGNYEAALASFDKVKEIAPSLEGNEYYRGVCLLTLARNQEAVEAFTASIESNYLLQFCYYNRGVCYVDLLEYEKAIEDMGMTLESGDDPDLIAAAKDILWQLASYFEQAPTT